MMLTPSTAFGRAHATPLPYSCPRAWHALVPHPSRAESKTSWRKTISSRRQQRLNVSVSAVATELAEVQEKFGIVDHVKITEGEGGLPKVVLRHSCGSKAEVYLYGAVVASWTQPSGDEVLYVRPDAKFDKSKPISGGIPHCFPQFGPGPAMQQHGFARNLDWTISATSADLQPDERDPTVELTLTDNDYTRKMWPHAFKAVYTVTLHEEQLRTDLRVINTGNEPFDFTAAMHTYIEVLDIEVAKVRGLQGLTFLDKVPNPEEPETKEEDREVVSFSGPVDSVYLKAKDYVELDVGTGAAVAISSSGWEDIVVWSPWTAMEDCYKKFCCVENAKFGTPATVQPGESWRGTQDFAVIDLE
ncbi:apospory-associated protein C [Coccomyxa subellipsoidea C-169]|uniref:glucose-6-phosphate 1-epimerase n=1 Tax=Coccomyxa subellipsoidea (strain C-169) TaxID=574566 RepID=I0Z7D3_COCSC|nr:apospory-associated protein C [Coccomyxa subellipsoidea C-169]EIE26552.1 apospory-associated protein C [Coccomyxa subellipsoidea C-169]|eukprot:XP_005651096.1 apospory-associated protein C [Coccomyxa subellipsoidea C-169]